MYCPRNEHAINTEVKRLANRTKIYFSLSWTPIVFLASKGF